MDNDIVASLQVRARKRRHAAHSRSKVVGEPDKLADLLDEAAAYITSLRDQLADMRRGRLDDLEAKFQQSRNP